LYQDNFFYNNWLDYEPLFQTNKNSSNFTELTVNLDRNFFENLKFDKQSLTEYKIEAAIYCQKTLGDNPALCISGGIDSQAMLNSFVEASLNFAAYTFVYNDDLNLHDVELARKYCTEHGIKLIEIPFDVVQFLSRENYDFGINYKSLSPHFNVHFKFCDILKNNGHSGVCFGGCTPYYNNFMWGDNFSKNNFTYITYSKLNQYPVQGSFLSYYPKLAWATAMLTPYTFMDLDDIKEYRNYIRVQNLRYACKVIGYSKVGFNIQESEKYTGFEKVKEYYASFTNDGYEFEKRFRIPLVRELADYVLSPSKFVFKYTEVENFLKNYLLNK